MASLLILHLVLLPPLLLCPCGLAAPILAPNMSSCHLPSFLPSDEPPFDCCAPGTPTPSAAPRLFRPSPPTAAPLRIRRPAHTASLTYAEQLARAYALMKALRPDDPRSFVQQANIHCAYCNLAYSQLYSSQLFQVHGGWLFLPFHRWYLFFHERILAHLLHDPTFSLPFWNYDLPTAASIPWLYSPSFNLTLVSANRNPAHHHANASVSIASPFAADDAPPSVKSRENANAFYRALIRDASSQRSFFGLPYRQGDSPSPGAGTIEEAPHNTVHVWVGDRNAVGMKDMGSFYAAARDPIFYAHHAQLDRLWELWKTIPGHEELMNEDYLNSEFAFYDENAELVRVKVGDALNTSDLGYAYEDAELPWLDATTTHESSGPAQLTSNDTMCVKGEPILAPCSVLLHRDLEMVNAVQWPAHGPLERLVLTVQCTEAIGAHLDIYLNLPSADVNTGTGCHEFLTGVETLSPVALMSMDAAGRFNVSKQVEMGERLRDLHLTDQVDVVATLVPTFPSHTSSASLSQALKLADYYIDYYSPQTTLQPFK